MNNNLPNSFKMKNTNSRIVVNVERVSPGLLKSTWEDQTGEVLSITNDEDILARWIAGGDYGVLYDTPELFQFKNSYAPTLYTAHIDGDGKNYRISWLDEGFQYKTIGYPSDLVKEFLSEGSWLIQPSAWTDVGTTHILHEDEPDEAVDFPEIRADYFDFQRLDESNFVGAFKDTSLLSLAEIKEFAEEFGVTVEISYDCDYVIRNGNAKFFAQTQEGLIQLMDAYRVLDQAAKGE